MQFLLEIDYDGPNYREEIARALVNAVTVVLAKENLTQARLHSMSGKTIGYYEFLPSNEEVLV